MIWIIAYQLFVVCLAWKNASWSNPKDEWRINHWLNGLFHCAASAAIWISAGWNFGIANLLFTRVVFDASMNIFRHFSLGYVSPAAESKIDQAERWIVLRLSELIYRNKRNVSNNDIERVAIGFRILILLTGIASIIFIK